MKSCMRSKEVFCISNTVKNIFFILYLKANVKSIREKYFNYNFLF